MTKADKTKKKLYDCAIRLFQEKGYDKVSIDEIVREAGTAKGTFYVYFETKAGILIQMLSEYDDHYDNLAAEFLAGESAEERLRKIAMEAGNFTQNMIGLDMIRALYTSQMGGVLKSELYTNRSLYRIVHDLLEEGQKNGEFRSDEDSMVLADRLINWIRGTFFVWCLQDGEFSLIEECRKLTELFCQAIQKEKHQMHQ